MAEGFEEFLSGRGITGKDVTTGETDERRFYRDDGDGGQRRVRGSELAELRAEFADQPAAAPTSTQPAPADRVPETPASNLPDLPTPQPLTFDEITRIRNRRERRAVLAQASQQNVFDFQQNTGVSTDAVGQGDLIDRLFGTKNVMKGYV